MSALQILQINPVLTIDSGVRILIQKQIGILSLSLILERMIDKSKSAEGGSWVDQVVSMALFAFGEQSKTMMIGKCQAGAEMRSLDI
jgi:hypothetical protein